MPAFSVSGSFIMIMSRSLGRLGTAFRLAWPWLAVTAVFELFKVAMDPAAMPVLFGALASATAGSPAAHITRALAGGIAGLVNLLAAASFSMMWWRYLLRGEICPLRDRFRIDEQVWWLIAAALVLSYLLFMVALPFMVAAVAIMLAGSWRTPDAALVDGWAALVANLIVTAVGLFAALRLSLVFPALALKRRGYAVWDSWRAMDGHALGLAGLALMMLLFFSAWDQILWLPGWVLGRPLAEAGLAGLLLTALLDLLHAAIKFLVGVTAAAVLYAIFVEKRQL